MSFTRERIVVFHSRMAREITEVMRDAESSLPLYHSGRVYDAEALTGVPRGLKFDAEFSDAEREAVVRAHPRSERFKERMIQTFCDGIRRNPGMAFGNVKADVIADKAPQFIQPNF